MRSLQDFEDCESAKPRDQRKDEFVREEAETTRYCFSAYLRDRAPALAVVCAGLACACAVLAVLGLGWQAILLVAGILLSVAAVCLLWDYRRQSGYFREALALAESLADGNLGHFVSLTPEPASLEARVAQELCGDVSRWSNEALSAEAARSHEYREYVELWVHEAKTPVAAARLVLANMHGRDAVKLARELDRIELQIEQALFYARSTSLSSDYAIRETALAEVARQAVKRNARLLIERGVAPSVEIAEDVRVFSDELWLLFILNQLLVNAAKYGAHSICMSAHEEEPNTPRGRTVLEVRDDGCGIPAADVPRVFDRGFTGQNGRAFGQATGMGLYLSALLCEKMGLGLAVASEEGSGTRVMISFPHDRRHLP